MAAAKAGLLALVLLAWQLASLLGLPDYVLSPLAILRHFFAALGSAELYADIGASLGRALPGFVIGSALRAALRLAAGVSRLFDDTFNPLVFLTYPVAKIVLLPLFMLWFGIEGLSKV